MQKFAWKWLRSSCRQSFLLALVACCVPWQLAAAQDSNAPTPPPSEKVTLLDGSTLAGQVTGISDEGLVEIAGQDPIPLAGLRQITRSQPKAPPDLDTASTTPAVVELVGGGRIVAAQVTLDDEACQLRWAYGEKLALGIDSIKAIRFFPDKPDPDFEAALKGESEEIDRIFLRVEEKLEVLRGLIESLDDKEIVFEYQGKESRLPRARLFGVIVAAIGAADAPADECLVRMAAGSSTWGESLGELALWGKLESLADGEIRLEVAGEMIALPWANVVSITVRSDRIVFLSDLKPVTAVQEPILAPQRPWQADRTVAGQTLTLRKQTFEKGLGVASYSKLVYELPGQYETFAATLGIDDETDGAGDAVFVVLGDGRELFRLRATGTDNPHQLRLDVSGVRRLELIVEPGEQLDLADHADWADACLIRPEKTSVKK